MCVHKKHALILMAKQANISVIVADVNGVDYSFPRLLLSLTAQTHTHTHSQLVRSSVKVLDGLDFCRIGIHSEEIYRCIRITHPAVLLWFHYFEPVIVLYEEIVMN